MTKDQENLVSQLNEVSPAIASWAKEKFKEGKRMVDVRDIFYASMKAANK